MPTTTSLTLTLEICPVLGPLRAQIYRHSWPPDFEGEIKVSTYRFGTKQSAGIQHWTHVFSQPLAVEQGAILAVSAKRAGAGGQKYSGTWKLDGQSLVQGVSENIDLVVVPERPAAREVRLELERRLAETGVQPHSYAHPLDPLYRAFHRGEEEPLTFCWLFGGSVCTFAFECDRNEQAAIERYAAAARESGAPPCRAYWYTPAVGLREITLEQAAFFASNLYETVRLARREAVQSWVEGLDQGRLEPGGTPSV